MADTLTRIRSVLTGVPGAPRYSNLYFNGGVGSESDYHDAVVALWTAAGGRVQGGATVTIEGLWAHIDAASGAITGTGNVGDDTLVTSGAGGELPLATCGLAQFHTGVYVGGREVRGRMFLPWPDNNSNAGGIPSSTYKDDWTNAFTILDDISHANGAFCVWSRKNGVAPLVTSTTVWNEYAVLRSQRQ